jgi:hypothetical protein
VDLFLDVNVYLDAFIAWNDDMRPTVLVTDTGTINGDPACAVLQAICEGRLLGGSPIVLHSSERVLVLVRAKLAEAYRWIPDKADDAVAWIVETVDGSGGRIVREGEVSGPDDVPGVHDVEDRYRLAEARLCGATLFLTRDQEILDSADADRLPFPMKPRAFIDRARPRG